MPISRRDFLATAALGSTSMALGLAPQEGKRMNRPPAGKRPTLITKTTALQSLDAAYDLLRRGGDTLDAVTLVCKAREDDPNDQTVGLGGLPNEDGVVELDASCMDGPTRRAGAVGAVKNIKNVSLLARAVMDHTGHVMLVGEGAEHFAEQVGFSKENLLTERSRKMWLLWKETMSHQDWWGPGLSDPNWKPPAAPTSEEWQKKREQMQQVAAELGIEPEWREHAIERVIHREHGTIPCLALNEKGEMSSMVSTSGLAWKIAGRVGDSPIIGAGHYTEQDVGSAGTTGNGEENIRVVGAHTIVENMRRGMLPVEAGMDTLQRLAHLYNNDKTRLRYIQMVYYILRNDGAYAGVSFWSQSYAGRRMQFAVHDGKARLEDTVALFEGPYIEWPPVPKLK